jgi:DNA polymerase-3 subunit delta
MGNRGPSGRSNVFQVLEGAPPAHVPPTIAIVGTDRFLRQLVRRHLLAKVDAENVLERIDGSECQWQDVADDLSTVSLFSSGPRRLLVIDADQLVKNFRREIEEHVQHNTRGLLLLELETLPGNTKLAQALDQHGMIVECKLPDGKQVSEGRFGSTPEQRWLLKWAEERHGIQLESRAAALLVDLIGWEIGMLDQELAKLALFLAPGAKADASLVQEVVGGWRTETTWEMLEAVADGDARAALTQLDHLLQSGEPPQALFGSIAWSLRRYAAATRVFEEQERQGRKPKLQDALLQAGFRKWPPGAVDRAAAQLRQMSRVRSGRLFRWLLDVDLALKGSHATTNRARQAIEILFLRLAREHQSRTQQPRSTP